MTLTARRYRTRDEWLAHRRIGEESWLPVPGWEGLYEVSDLGRVQSLPRARGTGPGHRSVVMLGGNVLVGHVNRGGYVAVLLSDLGRRRTAKVHVLVLAAFVGARPEGQECRHLDGDQTNNVFSNLVYGTHVENMVDQAAHGTVARGERGGLAKLTDSNVLDIRARAAAGEGIRHLGRSFGVDHTTIMDIVRRSTWRHL